MTAGVELVEYTTATKMAGVFRESVAKLKTLVLQLGEESRKLQEAFDSTYAFDVDVYFDGERHDADEDTVARMADRMKRQAWDALINKLGIRKLMSSKRARELDEAIAGHRRHSYDSAPPLALPEIDEETMYSVLAGMVQSADEFMLEAIHEEYDFWKPGTGEYKTNDPFALGRRVIKGWMVDREYGGGYRPCYQHEAHLEALDNIFHRLDGKGVPPGHYGQLSSAIRTCGPAGVGETDYFRFKCHKNHNLHLEFKRLDLLRQFNRLAGRNRLPQEQETSPD